MLKKRQYNVVYTIHTGQEILSYGGKVDRTCQIMIDDLIKNPTKCIHNIYILLMPTYISRLTIEGLVCSLYSTRGENI